MDELPETDNIVVWNFKTNQYDEIVDRVYDENSNVTHIILKHGGKITLQELDRDYGLAHESEIPLVSPPVL